ncbi:hypothetical protein [Flavobacterium sp. I3-2]|uniref:hypothetical protein n=1 Tax=Flavobacterium sp. I3-2 TaxID=2748319 RepID=UPI0015AA17F6|nr:hypothetical protein [Flavobacterium sp. I3-2]
MDEQLTELLLNPIDSIVENSYLQILLTDPNSEKRTAHEFYFVKNRVKPNSVTISEKPELTMINLTRAINLDLPLVFKAEVLEGSKVKIGVLDPKLVISDIISFNPETRLPIFESQIIVTPIEVFEILSITFLKAEVVPCSQVKVRVRTSIAMTSYCRSLSCTAVNSAIVEFTSIRGSQIAFKAIRNNVSRTININIPPLLNEPQISVFNSPFGATATATTQNFSGLTLQFSLDNINWQDSNVFSGLDVGSYTLYIKDQLGCLKSKTFTVLENSFGTKPYVFISKENSFRFKEPDSDYLNDENQFFNQSFNAINYCFEQNFLNNDVVTTQFKSNFQNIDIFVRDLNSNEISQLVVTKKTNNIGLKQKMSGVKKYKISNFQFGVYFESGSILNYDTNTPEQNYTLNGSLPIWAKLGNFINIDGAFYQINSIGFDENVNAEVLIFDGFMSNLEEEVVASCIYNIQEYEVYEFDLDFSYFSNSKIQIEIRNTDPNFGEYNWTSEVIRSYVNLENHIEIRYQNSTNTNVIYSTDIQHLLRIPYNKIKAVDSDSSENYNTDTNTYLLGSKIYEITEFDFMPLPLELWRKVKIALSVDTIFIDGVGYSKNAEFTKETLGSSNLYKVTAQLIKNGFMFNSNMNSNEIIIENPVTNIPGLIENNLDGFVGY